MSGKSSKKIGKIILLVVACCLALDLLLVGLLFVPAIQTAAVNKVTQTLSDKWGTEISIKDIRLTPTLKLVAHDFRIKDHHQNDMIYVGTVKGRILSFSTKPLKLRFKKVLFEDADIILRTYRGEESVNISVWAKNFKKTGKQILISTRCLALNHSRFVLIKDDKRQVFDTSNHPDIDYYYLELKDICADMDDFAITRTAVTTIAAKFKHLAFSQYGGFTLEDGHGDFSICDTALTFRNCYLSTPESKIDMNLQFCYDDWKQMGEFVDSVRFKVNIKPSFLAMQDVAAWAPALKGMDETFFIMADSIYGPINDFVIKDLNAGWHMANRINGDLAIKNITDFRHADIHLRLDPSTINVPELAHFTLPKGKTIPINKTVAKFGTTAISGTFDGNTTIFDAAIDAKSELGTLFANLTTQSKDGKIQLEGSLASPNFNLAKLSNSYKTFGKSDLFLSFDGNTGTSDLNFEKLHANISGDIRYLDILGYRLRNTTFDGEYRNKMYNCTVNADDPYFNCDILAQLDMTDALPALQGNITLNKFEAGTIAGQMPAIDSASAKGIEKLIYGLQHNPTLSFNFDDFKIALRGNNLENINGYLGCDNITVFNNDQTLTNDRLRLTAINAGDVHKYILSSGLANASLETTYPIKDIKQSLIGVVHDIFPTLVPTTANNRIDSLSHKYLKAHITTYRTRSFTRLIIPDLYIAPNSVIDVSLYSDDTPDNISANIPFIGLRNKGYARNIIIDGRGDADGCTMQMDISSDSIMVRLKETPLSFSTFSLNAQAKSDTVSYKLRCLNSTNESTASISQICGFSCIADPEDIVFNLNNSVVYINDSPWYFNDDNSIHIRKHAYNVNNLKFFNENGRILVDGTYSQNPDDKLLCRLTNVDMSIFNTYLGYVSFGGDLSADVSLRTRNNKPLVLGKVLASDFSFNDEKMGNLFAVAGLDTLGRIIFGGGLFDEDGFLSAQTKSYTFNDFNAEENILARLSGNYTLDKKTLLVNTSFDTLNASFLTRFLSGFSDHFTGTASGNLSFHASPDSTYFEGTVTANKVNMGIAALGTSYDVIDQDIRFNSEGIFFDNMRILDKDQNVAFMQGSIKHNFFKDMRLDLHINTDRIMAINTPKTPTAVFYGDGYVAGQVDIIGTSEDITFRGPSLRTLTGSKIVLQATSSNSTTQSNTIIFKPKETKDHNDEIVSPNSSSTNLNYDFTFDVTKDADVVLYLESIGGTMYARAEGRFQLLYNNDGLNLYGQLGIYSGDFRIALYNVVNSRFTLVPGGSINFDGPLENMEVQISAFKSSKTSLSNIIPNDMLSGNSANVNAYLHLNGPIMQKIEPTFSFELPNSSEEVRNSFYTAIDTTNTENLTKQFAYFMVTNNFMANDMFSSDRNTGGGLNFFSNMVNNIIGNMIDSKKGHFGITYNQATETSSAEYGVNASANLLKDRMSIETSIGYYDDQKTQRAANMYGDVTVEYSLNAPGTWKLKAYTYIGERDDDYVLHSEQLNYTAGVALAYKQDFGDVRRKHRNTSKNKKRKKDEKH